MTLSLQISPAAQRCCFGRISILPAIVCLSIGLLFARPVAAQQSAPPAAAAADETTEEQARQQILHSDRWQDMEFDFGQWLTGQRLYSKDQVEETKTRMNRGVSRMTAAQLQRFLTDMEARLDVLDSPMAQEAQVYFDQKLRVASDAYARRLRQDLPDLLTTSAAQIEQKLLVHSHRRGAAQQRQLAFDDARQRSVQMNQTTTRQAQSEERQRRSQRPAASTGAAAPGEAGGIAPARDYFPARERPSMMFFGGYGMF
ncbi:MAG TPA: hypothetical protein VGJ26_14450 [Pirellulales bacterium]